MNKLELNEKLARLYGVEETKFYYDMISDGSFWENEVSLIDDWNRLMPLALSNKIVIEAMNTLVLAGRDNIGSNASYSDHESIEAAARYALAMALVKLAKSKS